MPLRLEFIVQALEQIGTLATDTEIFDRIRMLHPEERFPKKPVDNVRQNLQVNSSDSPQFEKNRKKRDLFYRVRTPVPGSSAVRVTWGLRQWSEATSLGNGQRSESMGDRLEDEAEAFLSEEGRRRLRVHLAHERSGKLIRHFKDSLKKFDCRVCDFDFEMAYGARGRQFIEAHHVVPVAKAGERVVSVKDLVAVCSNCHRMLHRWGLLPWEELRQLVQSRRNRN